MVRGAAWLLLALVIIFGRRRPNFEDRPLWLFLIAMIGLAVAQLVPLPPAVWEALPGRRLFVDAAALAGTAQPWRPWTIVPSATLNALSSLIVPVVVLVFSAGLSADERRRLPSFILLLVVAAMLVGLLQLSGIMFDNPFVDDSPGEMSGIFANRNHFALILAFGILLMPYWTLAGRKISGWRWPEALGLVLLFFLTIIATGSRAGMAVGVIALIISLVLARAPIRASLRRSPRWVLPALIAGIVALIVLFVAISVSADRAASIHRLFALNPEDDMRRRALPTIWAMIKAYFPFGSGLGDFATVFQIYEPFDVLQMTYVNRAHNDYLEIVLNAGLPGLLLLIAAFGWWLAASLRVWRAGEDAPQMAKVGSAMLLLVFIASLSDYPSRTPMMMAIIILSASWLGRGDRR
jgi:O-antigen ligase